jgi:hypothetical protein
MYSQHDVLVWVTAFFAEGFEDAVGVGIEGLGDFRDGHGALLVDDCVRREVRWMMASTFGIKILL